MAEYKFTSEQIRMMKHTIGFERNQVRGIKNRRMEAYRNYFTTAENEPLLDDLVEQGLMKIRNFENGIGKNPQVYFISEEGYKLLSELTGIHITEMD